MGVGTIKMDASKATVLCFIVISLIAVQQAEAIKCWYCDSKTDGPTCGDPFRTSGVIDCDVWARERNYAVMPNACVKIFQYITVVRNRQKVSPDYSNITRRGCGFVGDGAWCDSIYGGGVAGQFCRCTGNHCNGSGSLGYSSVLFVMTGLAALLSKLFFF